MNFFSWRGLELGNSELWVDDLTNVATWTCYFQSRILKCSYWSNIRARSMHTWHSWHMYAYTTDVYGAVCKTQKLLASTSKKLMAFCHFLYIGTLHIVRFSRLKRDLQKCHLNRCVLSSQQMKFLRNKYKKKFTDASSRSLENFVGLLF